MRRKLASGGLISEMLFSATSVLSPQRTVWLPTVIAHRALAPGEAVLQVGVVQVHADGVEVLHLRRCAA